MKILMTLKPNVYKGKNILVEVSEELSLLAQNRDEATSCQQPSPTDTPLYQVLYVQWISN